MYNIYTNMKYYNKYLKYKNKYLVLKNSIKNDIITNNKITNNKIGNGDDFEDEEKVKLHSILQFQNEKLNKVFLAKPEYSYFCNNDRNFYNVEWVYNGVISYKNIIDINNDIYEAIYKIANNSSACDITNSIKDKMGTYGTGPQQTHVHVSYKNCNFSNIDEYNLFMMILLNNWTNGGFQQFFNNEFIENFDKWANENKDACGKPIIFTENKNEGIETLKQYKLHSNDLYEVELYEVQLYNTKFYTNIPFELIDRTLLNNTDDEVYDEQERTYYDFRYYDLNIMPSIDISNNDGIIGKMHVEFRALNNLVNIGGGANDFITNKYQTINNFLSLFARCVKKLFEKVFKDMEEFKILDFDNIYSGIPYIFDENNLMFGLEIETCLYIEN